MWQPGLVEWPALSQSAHNFRGKKPKRHVYYNHNKVLLTKPQKSGKPGGIDGPLPHGWNPRHPRGPVSPVASPMAGKSPEWVEKQATPAPQVLCISLIASSLMSLLAPPRGNEWQASRVCPGAGLRQRTNTHTLTLPSTLQQCSPKLAPTRK